MKIVTSKAREQLAEVAGETRRGAFSVVAILLVSALLYVPVLAALELFGPVETLVSGQDIVWYTVCSFTGTLLFVSASLLGNEADTEPDAPESRENVEIKEALWVMFGQVAKINAITVLLFSGVLAGVAVERVLGGNIAILVSVLYPAADMRLYQWIDKPVTPVTILMVISYIPAIAVTVCLSITLIAIGLVLGPPWAIVKSIGELRDSTGPTLPIQRVVRIPTPRRR